MCPFGSVAVKSAAKRWFAAFIACYINTLPAQACAGVRG